MTCHAPKGLALAAAALGALFTLSPAAADWSAANIAVPEISEHAPGAAAIRRSNSDELRLFAITRRGLSERHFVRKPGQPSQGWFDWRHDGKPAGMPADPAQWRRFLPVTSGWASLGTDVFTFFDFPDTSGAEKIGIGHLTSRPASPPFALDFQWQPENPMFGVFPELFNPQTVASDNGFNGMDVFGTNSDDGRPGGTTSLLRLHGGPTPMGTTFSPQNIGRPMINGASASVALGPQATATAILGQRVGPPVVRHMVFVKAHLAAEDHVTFAIGDTTGGPFTWGIDLGAPKVGFLVDSPLAVSYSWTECSDCRPIKRVTVWVTTFDRTADRHTLWERHFDARDNRPSDPGQIAEWSPWQTFGSPAGLASRTPFRLTSGLVWYQNSALRINMFGYTDGDTDGPERIVEFYWDPNGWHWGSPSLRTPPSGAGVRTMSATVLQSPQSAPTYTRLSVFARTGGTADPVATDVGHIWELYYVIENGVGSGWKWNDLSFECVSNPFPRMQNCVRNPDTR